MEGESANFEDEDRSNEWTLTNQRCRHARAHLRSLCAGLNRRQRSHRHHGRPAGSPSYGTRNESPYIRQWTPLSAATMNYLILETAYASGLSMEFTHPG